MASLVVHETATLDGCLRHLLVRLDGTLVMRTPGWPALIRAGSHHSSLLVGAAIYKPDLTHMVVVAIGHDQPDLAELSRLQLSWLVQIVCLDFVPLR